MLHSRWQRLNTDKVPTHFYPFSLLCNYINNNHFCKILAEKNLNIFSFLKYILFTLYNVYFYLVTVRIISPYNIDYLLLFNHENMNIKQFLILCIIYIGRYTIVYQQPAYFYSAINFKSRYCFKNLPIDKFIVSELTVQSLKTIICSQSYWIRKPIYLAKLGIYNSDFYFHPWIIKILNGYITTIILIIISILTCNAVIEIFKRAHVFLVSRDYSLPI